MEGEEVWGDELYSESTGCGWRKRGFVNEDSDGWSDEEWETEEDEEVGQRAEEEMGCR